MSKLAPAAYSAQPTLFLMIILEMVNLSITWGNCEESAFAYSNYGIILCGVLGDIEKGFQFGQVALNLLSKLKAIKVKTKTEFSVNNFIRPWKESLHKNLKLSLTNYQMGLETGDLEFGAYSLQLYVEYAFLSGVELGQLKSEIISYTELIRQMGQERIIDGQNLYHQAISNLTSATENNFVSFSGSIYHEEVMLPILLERGDGYAICNHYFNKLIFSYLFANLEEAIVASQEIKKYLDSIKPSALIVYFYFYASLSYLASVHNVNYYLQFSLLKRITKNQQKLKKWAKFSPMNYLHKYYLVEAEIFRVLGKNQPAIDYYDKAISLAKENEFVNEVALGYELAAKFYLAKGKELTARAYMQEARYYYQLWGAIAKVKDLEKRYPQLLATQGKTQENKTVTSITTTGSDSNLDLATIIKANQAISSEIMLDNLLTSLMKILIENAGAQRGYLILADQGKLLIEAEGNIDGQQVTLWKSTPINNCQNISQSIVNYVARTQESVILNDATQEGQFTNDIYLKEKQPKSILCVPLINQGQLISIVYLENNLTTEAFTPERINILQLLSGQAAISLQNAKLYAEVRDNEKRLIELNQAYERFVPRQFLQFLEKSSIVDVKLGDQVQLEMSVLFSDIRSFTTLSERMTPEDNFKFINSYLSEMEPAIIENHGFIDKYIGDAIMALFSGEADNAIKAGIAMLERLKISNQDRINSGEQPIQNGIGINTGSLMLGTVGGQNRMDGTVISDAVNLASRVESLTKNYGVSLLITEQTYSRLSNPNNYTIRIIDTVKVKGKSQAVTVYEVFDADLPEVKDGKLKTLNLFTEALSLYNQGNLTIATFNK
jgi:class 3 adenylate cyclase/GAF domain-containing protein